MVISTAQELRNADNTAINDMGIPSTLLMERAAKGLCTCAQNVLQKTGGQRVMVFCGAGNNGGDGVAVARMLKMLNYKVRTVLVGNPEKMTEDCREMARRLEEIGGELEPFAAKEGAQSDFCMEADLIIDAIFGIGLNSDLRGDGLLAVQRINASEAKVIAADIPSGLSADTGMVLGDAVKADMTVTFSRAKPGLFAGRGRIYAGKVIVHNIGIPDTCFPKEKKCIMLTDEDAAKLLPKRQEDSHKGDYGKVALLAGSVGYSGAPVLAANSCVRSGAGLVTLYCPESIYSVVASKCLEVMPSPVKDNGKTVSYDTYEQLTHDLGTRTAVLIGPGLGRDSETDKLVCKLVASLTCPIVLDADGLNAISEDPSVLKVRRRGTTILTPHDGEFERLCKGWDRKDRIASARAFAQEYGCVLVLKGHCTIIATPEGEVYLNNTGNSGMAKGGSGDVLSGIVLAFAGMGMETKTAAALAVWVHGRAGDKCAEAMGKYGMLPSDMINTLPRVLFELEKA